MTLRIAHLIDDCSPGGVMRHLSRLEAADGPLADAEHIRVPVRRGALRAPKVEADVIVSHLALRWTALPMLISLRSDHARRRLLHVEHSYCQGFQDAEVTAIARFHALLRVSWSLFDGVIAVSEGQAEWMRAEDLLPSTPLHVARPLTDLSAVRRLKPVAEGAPRVFGAIGRFDRQKGLDILIEAFRKAASPDAELRLYGDGEAREALQALAAGDVRITFPGFTHDPAEALAGLDAVVMPSRWEAYGLSGLEARAAGRPLLASATDGLRDQIADGAIPVRGRLAGWASAFRRPPHVSAAEIAWAREQALRSAEEAGAVWRELLTEAAGERVAA